MKNCLVAMYGVDTVLAISADLIWLPVNHYLYLAAVLHILGAGPDSFRSGILAATEVRLLEILLFLTISEKGCLSKSRTFLQYAYLCGK